MTTSTMTPIELITHLSKNLTKVMADHGPESEATTVAFFQLQGAKMCMKPDELYPWALAENQRLKNLNLSGFFTELYNEQVAQACERPTL